MYTQHLGSDADALVARWPVLVVPALYIADDMLLDLLDAYARAGGHLVLGFRSGYADDEARPRAEVMPGRLRAAVGRELQRVHEPRRAGAAAPGPTPASRSPTARPRRRGRMRSCRRAPRSLVGYEHPHLGRWAAVTTNAHGEGRVTYVGTLPDRALAVALARWLRPAPDAWADRPETVTVTSARNRRGRNAALRVELVMGTDELGAAGGGARPAVRDRPPRGEELDLAAWDVRVLLESPRENNEEDAL